MVELDVLSSKSESEQINTLHELVKVQRRYQRDSKIRFCLSGVNDGIKRQFLQDYIEIYQNLKKHDDGFYDRLTYLFMMIIFLEQRGEIWSEKKEDSEKDNYKYIPFNRERFLRFIDIIMKKIPGKIDFLDIGSGIGDKTMLSNLHPRIVKSWGVELNRHTFELSKFFRYRYYQVIGFHPDHLYETMDKFKSIIDHPVKCINMDALDFRRKDVGNGRKILFYSYIPIRGSREKLRQLYKRFLEEMEIGDYYWEVGNDITYYQHPEKFDFKFLKSYRREYKGNRECVYKKVDKNILERLSGRNL